MTLFDEPIVAGTVVRVAGLRGLFRAMRPCTRNQRAFWFLPCDRAGTPNYEQGWRAFPAERCKPRRTR